MVRRTGWPRAACGNEGREKIARSAEDIGWSRDRQARTSADQLARLAARKRGRSPRRAARPRRGPLVAVVGHVVGIDVDLGIEASGSLPDLSVAVHVFIGGLAMVTVAGELGEGRSDGVAEGTSGDQLVDQDGQGAGSEMAGELAMPFLRASYACPWVSSQRRQA